MASRNIVGYDDTKPGIPQLADQIELDRDDAKNHAQATSSFTDKSGTGYNKGAKGWAVDAESYRDDALTYRNDAYDAVVAAEGAGGDLYKTGADLPASTGGGAFGRVVVDAGRIYQDTGTATAYTDSNGNTVTSGWEPLHNHILTENGNGGARVSELFVDVNGGLTKGAHLHVEADDIPDDDSSGDRTVSAARVDMLGQYGGLDIYNKKVKGKFHRAMKPIASDGGFASPTEAANGDIVNYLPRTYMDEGGAWHTQAWQIISGSDNRYTGGDLTTLAAKNYIIYQPTYDLKQQDGSNIPHMLGIWADVQVAQVTRPAGTNLANSGNHVYMGPDGGFVQTIDAAGGYHWGPEKYDDGSGNMLLSDETKLDAHLQRTGAGTMQWDVTALEVGTFAALADDLSGAIHNVEGGQNLHGAQHQTYSDVGGVHVVRQVAVGGGGSTRLSRGAKKGGDVMYEMEEGKDANAVSGMRLRLNNSYGTRSMWDVLHIAQNEGLDGSTWVFDIFPTYKTDGTTANLNDNHIGAIGFPVLTTTQRDALAGPGLGWTIFNSTTDQKEVYTSTGWVAG